MGRTFRTAGVVALLRCGLAPGGTAAGTVATFLLATASLFGGWGCTPRPAAREHVLLEGPTMGTTWHVTVVGPGVAASGEALRSAVQSALDLVNQAMSTYDPDSELSQFNRAPAGVPVPVSEPTVRVMRRALEVAERSGGAFDPTVLPLVLAWGFGGNDRTEPPTIEEIAIAADLVDYHSVVVDTDARTLTKVRDGTCADLSAIAKGFGVDQVCRALDDAGRTDYLVEVGGEVRARGKNPRGADWRVGIDRPDPAIERSGAIQTAVAISGVALATSGDYRNFRVLDGQRVSHTIDPRTGHPIRHALASVSVIAATCMDADALATCVNVLGPEAGLEFIEAIPDTEAYLIIRQPAGTFEVKATPGFSTRLVSR